MTLFNQLIQELSTGVVRRHVFTQWELELLLDLQTCRIRKTARPEMLRRYQRAVQQHIAGGNTAPLRLSTFLEREQELSAPNGEENRRIEPSPLVGLSSK